MASNLSNEAIVQNPDFDNDTTEDYDDKEPPITALPLDNEDIIFMAARCFTTAICLIGLILLLVFIAKGHRFKG